MKVKLWLVLFSIMAAVLVASSVGLTRSSSVDSEGSGGNAFTAWASTAWVQTSQLDFEAGMPTQVDTSSAPGDVTLAARNDWYDVGWSYRKRITIDSTKVHATLSNFPVLINTTDTSLTNARADGFDFVFTEDDGTSELKYEREKWNDTTGELIAWIKVPSLSSSTDTAIYLYYGNPLQSTDKADPENVWDDNYEGVWHLTEDASGTGTADLYKDSTSNSNDGDDYISASGKAGKIDSGQEFDGTDDYLDLPAINATYPTTLSVWIRADTLTSDTRVVGGKDSVTGHDITCLSIVTDDVRVWDGDAWNTLSSSNEIGTTDWHYLAFTVTSAGTSATGYIDGAQKLTDSSTATNWSWNESSLTIGAKYLTYGAYFDGLIDEVRISNVARSAEWIKTCYSNQSDPGDFYSIGSEEGQFGWGEYWGTYSSELLVNPDAEIGATTGWTAVGTHTANFAAGTECQNCPSGGAPAGPRTGTYSFMWNAPTASDDWAYQEIDLYANGFEERVSAGKAQLRAGGYLVCGECTANWDRIQLRVLLYDSGHSLIETSYDSGQLFQICSWTWYGIEDYDIPTNARYVRVEFQTIEPPSWGAGKADDFTVKVRVMGAGTVASQVLDTAVPGVRWDALFWDETLEPGTDITFEVRASDSLFAKDAATPSWTLVGGTSPVNSGLPSGRYMQWRATLSTSDTSETPALHEVRVYHY